MRKLRKWQTCEMSVHLQMIRKCLKIWVAFGTVFTQKSVEANWHNKIYDIIGAYCYVKCGAVRLMRQHQK